ncbi:MAG: hypothetical protein KJ728_11825 [Alphaproteobacteria bacterium]|uniref:Uncharacterized protein n=1 Tax=viral metagenome TaxID=1070528 RepID=A0A6M3XBT4_9ZZZZ|nr:hypothetical protein [Alphaproteobacteria bacterium]
MVCATCSALRHEISQLKEEISEWQAWAEEERGAAVDDQRLAHWRSLFGGRGAAPVLTLMALADRPGRLITARAVIEATRIGSVKETDDVQCRDMATTRICQLRDVLRTLAGDGRLPDVFGARRAGIDTVWGQGWMMTAENAAAVRALAGEA